MGDLIKFLMFLVALYGAYHSARKAWRLGTELFGQLRCRALRGKPGEPKRCQPAADVARESGGGLLLSWRRQARGGDEDPVEELV
jgi:hypothetical protein